MRAPPLALGGGVVIRYVSSSARADAASDADIERARARRHARHAGAVAGLALALCLGDVTEHDIAERCLSIGRESGYRGADVLAQVMRIGGGL